ncbi:unnamed protein product [Arctogadus glacialis]
MERVGAFVVYLFVRHFLLLNLNMMEAVWLFTWSDPWSLMLNQPHVLCNMVGQEKSSLRPVVAPYWRCVQAMLALPLSLSLTHTHTHRGGGAIDVQAGILDLLCVHF